MFMWCAEVRVGLNMRQSLLVPASSLPLGVGTRRGKSREEEEEEEEGRTADWSSSHISAMLSL